MPVLVGLLGCLAAIGYLIVRANDAVKDLHELDRNTRGLQRHARNMGLNLFGSRLQRVSDPRLAATILMLQLVRTGAPVTATEKTVIMELMETKLHIANIQTIFVRAWAYTEQSRVFSPIADELLPLLRGRLTEDERLDFVDMLNAVANAYGEASELQAAAIARIKRLLFITSNERAIEARRAVG